MHHMRYTYMNEQKEFISIYSIHNKAMKHLMYHIRKIHKSSLNNNIKFVQLAYTVPTFIC